MSTLRTLTLFVMLAAPIFAQRTPLSAEQYDKAFEFALTETNQRYPFIHTFTSQSFGNGEVISDSVQIAERQAPGVERQTFIRTRDGETEKSYQLRIGFGNNVFCSSDGKSWTGPQTNECPRSIIVYRPDSPYSAEYSVELMSINRKKVKAYRKFEVFGTDLATQTFSEEVALIGSDGLFISNTVTKGNLKTRVIGTKLTNSWKLNAKFDPIVVPNDVKPSSDSSQKVTIIRN